jgi:hypothetical protein
VPPAVARTLSPPATTPGSGWARRPPRRGERWGHQPMRLERCHRCHWWTRCPYRCHLALPHIGFTLHERAVIKGRADRVTVTVGSVRLCGGSTGKTQTMANERVRLCLGVTLEKPMLGLVEVKWCTLGLLQKQKSSIPVTFGFSISNR